MQVRLETVRRARAVRLVHAPAGEVQELLSESPGVVQDGAEGVEEGRGGRQSTGADGFADGGEAVGGQVAEGGSFGAGVAGEEAVAYEVWGGGCKEGGGAGEGGFVEGAGKRREVGCEEGAPGGGRCEIELAGEGVGFEGEKEHVHGDEEHVDEDRERADEAPCLAAGRVGGDNSVLDRADAFFGDQGEHLPGDFVDDGDACAWQKAQEDSAPAVTKDHVCFYSQDVHKRQVC